MGSAHGLWQTHGRSVMRVAELVDVAPDLRTEMKRTTGPGTPDAGSVFATGRRACVRVGELLHVAGTARATVPGSLGAAPIIVGSGLHSAPPQGPMPVRLDAAGPPGHHSN